MKTLTIRFPLLLLLAAFLYRCTPASQKKGNEKNRTENTGKGIDFSKALRCSDYSFDGGYFLTADAGCIYNPEGPNTIGNLILYLVPKKLGNLPEDSIAVETRKINTLSEQALKRDFNIYVYAIDKRYLNYNKEADPVYYQKPDYEEKLYSYDRENNEWRLLDSITINHVNPESKEQNWRENFIRRQIDPALNTRSGPYSEKWYGTYTLTINGESSDWRAGQDLFLKIGKDSIVFHAAGYQIDQTYLLSASETDHSLKLHYRKAKDNTGSAVLQKTKDFGRVTLKDKTFTWSCPYLDSSFGSGKSKYYTLTKEVTLPGP